MLYECFIIVFFGDFYCETIHSWYRHKKELCENIQPPITFSYKRIFRRMYYIFNKNKVKYNEDTHNF